MFAVLDVRGECFHKRLYEVGESYFRVDWWGCHMLVLLGLWTLEAHRRVEYVHDLVGLDGVWFRNLFG